MVRSRVLDVPAHRQIGAVDLQDEAGIDDRLVFLPHRLGDRLEIGLVALVVAVVEEQRDQPRRGGAEKALLSAGAVQRRSSGSPRRF